VALLRAEITGLRAAVLTLAEPPAGYPLAGGAAVLEITGMHEAERLALSEPVRDGSDVYCRAALTYRDQLSVRSVVSIDDPTAFVQFFEDLARHKNGWEGEKKIATGEGQFTITCAYEGKMYRPEVSMDVYCAPDDPSFDPYWAVQLHLDLDPETLEELAARARTVFARAAAGAE
jgi:hypothetical protein